MIFTNPQIDYCRGLAYLSKADHQSCRTCHHGFPRRGQRRNALGQRHEHGSQNEALPIYGSLKAT